MKRIILIIAMILIAAPCYGQATSWNINSRPDANWWTGASGGGDLGWEWAKAIDALVAASSSAVAWSGDNFYVDSGLTTAGDGSNWANALATLDEAVVLCTEDNGDTIHIKEAHAEDFSAADAADLDVAGIRVLGYGVGEARPLFTITAAAGELVIGDASIWLENLRFRASVDSVVHIIEVEGDADGYVIYNCEFMEPESASTVDEADDIIQVAAGANKGFIIGCTFYSLSAGANTAIDLTAGVIEDLTIAGNEIVGDWAEAGIYSDDIDLRHRYYGNTIQNTNSGNHGIWLNAATTGWSAGNHIITDAVATSYDAGSLQVSNTDVWSDSDTTDVVAVPIFTSETGVDIWAASQTTQIQGAATAAIEADFLEMLIAATVADEIVDSSFLADLTTTGSDWSDFVASTDSLQAISDKITALTGYIHSGTNSAATSTTPVVSALIGYGDDYFNTDWVMVVILNADAVGTAPEGDVRDITNYVSVSGTFTIDATSAALATGDIVMVARKENFILAGIASGSGAYPSGVADDSILAMLLSKSATPSASSYVNTTDAMEMLSDKIGAYAGTSGAGVGESLLAAIALLQTDLDTVTADTEDQDDATGMQALTGTAVVSTTGVAGAPTAKTLADSLCKDGSFTFDNTTDALEAMADQIEYSMTVTRTKDGGIDLVSGTNNLFVVSGPVEVTVLTGIVANTLKAAANDCKFIHTTTVPAGSVDLTSAIECNGDAAGTSYSINTTIGGALIATTAGTVATSTCVEFLAPAGTIGFNAAGTFDAGDSIVFYIKYKPLISGARVAASP